jgi:hypothetical protein
MHENRSGGHSAKLLLLIPAAFLVARAAARHHQMAWDDAGEPAAVAPHRRHRRHGFAPEGASTDAFRLPPRVERTLEAWHARAHQPPAAGPADTEPA